MSIAWLFVAAVAMPSSQKIEREVDRCIQETAAAYQIEPLALELIREVEGGQPGSVSPNSNGTADLGVMQVNSSWLGKLGRLGITRDEIRDDACINVAAAAWIFVQVLERHGDLAKAIAYYHSPTGQHQARYLRRIEAIIERRLAASIAPPPP